MPESTTCLHIESPGTDAVRVVDLPGGTVRIGRASYCDVRLSDAGLNDEECRLRARGGSWQLAPVGTAGSSVVVDDRPLTGPVTLTPETSFRVGPHRVTIRASGASPWADPSPTVPAVGRPVEPAGKAVATRHRPDWSGQDRWAEAGRETKRWESKWRAAGQKLRSAAPPMTPAPPAAKVPGRPAVPASASDRPGLPSEALSRRTPSPLPSLPPASRVTAGVTTTRPPRPADYAPPASRPARPTDRDRVETGLVPATPISVADEPGPGDARQPVASDITPENVSIEPAAPPEWPAYVETRDVAETHDIPATRVAACEHNEAADVTRISVDVAVVSAESFEPLHAGAEAGGEESASRTEPTPTEIESLNARLETFDVADLLSDEPGADTERLGDEPAVSPADDQPVAGDDDDEDRDEQVAPSRPILGATRRGVRVSATADESCRPGARWIFHRPTDEPPGAEPDGATAAPATAVADRSGVSESWSIEIPSAAEPQHAEGRDAGAWSTAGVALTAGTPGREAGEPAGSDAPAESSREWPSVRDIFAAQGVRARPQPAAPAARSAVRRPVPTAAAVPAQWRLPLWLAWLPGAATAAGVGVAGLTGAWAWAADGDAAGEVARRLTSAEAARVPLPEGVGPASGGWWATSASHLVQFAAYLDTTGRDPARTTEARALLDRAASFGPLNPTVRYATAHDLPGEPPAPAAVALVRSLGQSRDVPTLAWAGHRLLAAGKKEAALRAYRAALEMAVGGDLARRGAPSFLDDPQFRRYALPAEGQVAAVVRDMAGADAWTYKEWSQTLPRGTTALTVAARVLRASGSPDAGPALDAALAEAGDVAASGGGAGGADEAVRLAASAEAMAMTQRWADARDRYRQAIDLMPVDAVRRAWWLNLADLSARLNDESERQRALDAAKSADLKDEITRRVVEIQKSAGADAAGRVAGVVPGFRH